MTQVIRPAIESDEDFVVGRALQAAQDHGESHDRETLQFLFRLCATRGTTRRHQRGSVRRNREAESR